MHETLAEQIPVNAMAHRLGVAARAWSPRRWDTPESAAEWAADVAEEIADGASWPRAAFWRTPRLFALLSGLGRDLLDEVTADAFMAGFAGLPETTVTRDLVADVDWDDLFAPR